MTDEAQDCVDGTVATITYRNDETGYTVCQVITQNPSYARRAEKVTVVATCGAIWVGEDLHAEGEWITHPVHGRQFQARTLRCVTPTSTEGIKRYLSSGIIKGIGPKSAERIVNYFGDKTIEIIDTMSARLFEVKGIGKKNIAKIRESWVEQRGIREIMIFLQSYGIGVARASRIFRQYGSDTIAVVKSNPYRLCDDVWGIGFKTADDIALSVGIPHDSLVRARAGLIHTLQVEADEGGHCFTIDADLLLHAQEMLDISVEILAEALNDALAAGTIVKEENRIYLHDLYRAETRASEKLKLLLTTPQSFRAIDSDRAIQWAESRMGFTLAPQQSIAVANALRAKVSIITGGPGVGKTTIIRALTEIFSARHLEMHLAAPTGRAAKRMAESTGYETQTIHRMLKFNPAQRAFEFNLENPMSGDVFILDEMSMVDIRLMEQFVLALPNTATLIFVGDTDQLPSVGPGNVLRDLIASGMMPSCSLDVIFRQDNSGLIVRNAHHVNHGEGFETCRGESDFYFIDVQDPQKVIDYAVDFMTTRIPMKFHMNPLTDVQVLTPMRKNSLGVEYLNEVIQKRLNPHGDALMRGAVYFRVRDRVMQLRNNYDKGVFNGDIGFITRVNLDEHTLTVSFDGRDVEYKQGDLDELVLAYACTIHKSQGSEYSAVIVLMHTQHFKLLQRNLLYTAITRGKKLVLVIGASYAIKMAIQSNQVRERRTTLAMRLKMGLDKV